MAKDDWDISGDGGISIIEDGGSKRCRLTYHKLMLWNGNSELTDCEIIANIQMGSNSNCRGGLILRSNESGQTAYRLWILGKRTYYIQKIIDGTITNLASNIASTRAYSEYVKTRFRIDGFQISIEEWDEGEWQLVTMVEDTSQAIINGYVGLWGNSVNSSYYITFDNVEINKKEGT